MSDVLSSVKERMSNTIEYYRGELKTLRTGRATMAMFDNLVVDYYGTPTPIHGVGTINIPEARMVTIQPWDASMIPAIEKAIHQSSLGLNPSNDGQLIRIPIPQLTEERRKEIVKNVKKMAEEARVAIRNERRDANDEVKKLEKNKEISEDDAKKLLEKVQDTTNEFIAKIDEMTESKEKELMEI